MLDWGMHRLSIREIVQHIAYVQIDRSYHYERSTCQDVCDGVGTGLDTGHDEMLNAF